MDVREWVSADARSLAASALGRDRILVTGASGWFGRTALDLLAPLRLPTLAIASRPRAIRIGDDEIFCRAWDSAEVAGFEPTVVVDCAFLMMGRIAGMPLNDYIRVNRTLTDRMVFATQLPGVRLALTISSGASIHPHDALDGRIEDNPYGYLKREADHRLVEAATKSGAVPVVA